MFADMALSCFIASPSGGPPTNAAGPPRAAAGRPLRRAAAVGPLVALPRVVVGIQSLLRWPIDLRHVHEIDSNAVPQRRTAAHPVHEQVGGLQCPGRCAPARLPSLKAGERLP